MVRTKIFRNKKATISTLIVFILAIGALIYNKANEFKPIIQVDDIPEYSGKGYVEINGNIPFFTDNEITSDAYEEYGDLDNLGRCTQAVACLGKELMPTEERESLDTKPTGWVQMEYEKGKYLYNRSHLIAFSLAGENDNKRNLITGTQYMNQEGMKPFEMMVLDYINETGNHVMYRVSPIFDGDNLLASGVLIEAYSVEDEGEGITFNVYIYNVQPGISIDYATGRATK